MRHSAFFSGEKPMIHVDLHAHTHFSRCGLHSIIEMLEAARAREMTALAITDHGLSLGGHINSSFYERLHDPVDGIRLLKGIESNVVDHEGTVDCPREFLPYMDVVLLGLHHNISHKLKPQEYTDMVIRALDANPYIAVITHPNDPNFPVEMSRLAAECAERGVALELNNSKIVYNRVESRHVEALIDACKVHACPVVINSDSHAVNEVGDDSAMRPFVQRQGLPRELIRNRDAQEGMAFVACAKERIQSYLRA